MTQYTVTIESQLGESTTVLRIETAPQPRIVEVNVRAGNDGAISSTTLPPVDLAAIAAAFSGACPHRTDEPERAANARPVPRPRPVPPAEPPTVAGDERATRNYRRMPDVAELVEAYREAASVTELARQYGVPRHTMNAWLGRLRREGVIERR
ncbi:hypothetical protein MRQ36_24770 [Micromonospora sp. R77]|uniref:hypothetical protein n=1 Tax=Micromonospora sp. R77 TaxID=2925836 RepID=UPI001F61EADE|nr:hypothetical protein [Micromonospora sp. R77]MCI4065603.1 hypothetical protein [Micromonospora sp. R77]